MAPTDSLALRMNHLRFSGLSDSVQRTAFLDIVWRDALVRDVLLRARDLALPQWRIVSGVLYNTVWNALTGRPPGYGVRDVDLFYFDAGDVSYAAEDGVIQRAAAAFDGVNKPIEVRNQARVHLWFEQRFGHPYPPLHSCEEAIGRFASTTHSVGLRLAGDDTLDLHAPFGLDDIFSFRVAPNRLLDNRRTHLEKAARAREMWPEITIVQW